MRIIVICIVSILFFSCKNSFVFRGSTLHTIPSSFDDTIYSITQRLDSCHSCNYVLLIDKSGNCFGGSLAGYAQIIWTQNEAYFIRTLSKAHAENRKVKDKSSRLQHCDIFQYFSNFRIDTVTTFPQRGWEIIPESHAILKVKNENIFYEKIFESNPFFTSKDTLHPLYVFVKKVRDL